MFILGILAFLQMVFIPGFLSIKYLGFHINGDNGDTAYGKTGIIRLPVYSFGLSLLINYLLVFALTAAGLYRPLSLYILLFIEALFLIRYWLYRSKTFHGKPFYRCRINLKLSQVVTSVKRFFTAHSYSYNLILLISIVVILRYAFLFFYSMGGVFDLWDPVVSWNRFTLDWAANRFPSNTWRYPQLIPANWSISYVMMQNTEVQCFASAIMPLFSIAVLLLFLDLALQKKKAAYLLGLTSYGAISSYLYSPVYIVSGYVDIAVSFFGFLAFHTLYSSRQEDGSRPYPAILLATVFASAASVTKQAGLFILAVILAWGFLDLVRNHRILGRDRNIPAPPLTTPRQ